LDKKWDVIAPTDLRRLEGGLYSTAIKNEFDGPIILFGQRAWEHIFSLVPDLKRQLKNNQPLEILSYSDRYLRSPLVLRLLMEFLRPLTKFPGGIDHQTRISIQTSQIFPHTQRYGRLVFHDWCNAERGDVLKNILTFKSPPNVIEKKNHEMPHARELNLTWQNGKIYKLRFDQGMGYWHLDRRSDASFPFDKPADLQLQQLIGLSVDIQACSQDYPTHWYIGENR